MVSKPLIISLLSVVALAAADTLWQSAPNGSAPQSSGQTQIQAGVDASPAIVDGQETLGGNSLENPLTQIGSQAFDIISERILFNPARRQPVIVAEIVQVPIIQEVAQAVPILPAPDPQDFTLLGVVVADQSRIALLRWNQTQEVLRLKSGDIYTGWKIAAINDRNIMVEQQGKSFTLSLFKGQGGEPATIAAPD